MFYLSKTNKRFANLNYGWIRNDLCNTKYTATMKAAFTCLTLLLFALVCCNKQTERNDNNKDNSEISKTISIKGIWTIKKYYFSDISAMDERMANEWLNKQVQIDNKLYFDFQKINSYKDDFKNENDCDIQNADKPEVVSTGIYFDSIRDPLAELKIIGSTINIYRTACQDNPFSELVINEDKEIVFKWDGVFFIMVKE